MVFPRTNTAGSANVRMTWKNVVARKNARKNDVNVRQKSIVASVNARKKDVNVSVNARIR